MGFLDSRPYNAMHPDGRALLAALQAAFYQVPVVQELVLAAGLHPAEFSWQAPMSQVWPQVLRKAADSGQLRSLITAAAQDPDSVAYDVIVRLLAEPDLSSIAQGYLGIPAEFPSGLDDPEAGAVDVRHPLRLPRLADSYQRRPEQEALEEILVAGRSAAFAPDTALTTCVLAGSGGAGKTQIARAYSHQAWEDPALSVAVWVNAGSREEIVGTYAEVNRRITGRSDTEPEQAARELVDWLRSTDLPWLMVLDGLRGPDDLEGLWPPDAANGRLVVTTRDRAPSLWNGSRNLIPVGVFDESQSEAFLQDRLAGSPHLLRGVGDLAATLGHLPLALSHAAAVMLARKWTAERYTSRFLDESRKLSEVAVPRPNELMPDDRYRQTIATTWRVSVDLASGQEPQGVAGHLLAIASLLRLGEIPAELFTSQEVADYLSGVLGRPVIVDDAHDGLALLDRYSLVTADLGMPDGTVSVHPLVQRATRDELRPGELARVAVAAADALDGIWPDSGSLASTDAAHLLYLNAAALDRLAGSHLISPDTGCHSLLLRIGKVLGALGRPHAARDYFLELAARTREILGPDNPHTMRIRHYAASALGMTRDDAGALRELHALYADCRRVLGDSYPDTLAVRASRASCLARNGDVSAAISELEAVLDTQESALPPFHLDTLDTRARLAKWRGHAGQVAAAISALEQLLADYQEHQPAAISQMFLTRASLATWRGHAGNYAVAAEELRGLLRDRLRAHGPSEDTIRTRASLLRWYQAAKNKPAAKAAKRELRDEQRLLFSQFESRYGTRNPDALGWHERSAPYYLRKGDLSGDIAAMQALIADREETLTPQHPLTLESRMRLANLVGGSGNPAGAVTQLRDVPKLAEQTLGDKHPMVLDSLFRLASWQARAHDPDGAISTLRVLLSRQRAAHASVYHVCTTLKRLIVQYRAIENQLGVGESLGTLLEYRRSFLPPDHPDVLRTRLDIAVWRADLGMADTAAEELRWVSDGYARIRPLQDPEAMNARRELARCLWAAGKHHQARATLSSLIDDQRDNLGAEHKLTVANEQELSRWQEEHGQPQHGPATLSAGTAEPADQEPGMAPAKFPAVWVLGSHTHGVLLEALGLACGPGLTRGLWLLLANAVSPVLPVGDADIEALLAAEEHTVATDMADGAIVYRLSHPAIARRVFSLAARRTGLSEEFHIQLRHQQVTDALIMQFPRHDYVARCLPRHAALGRCLYYLSWPPAILDHVDLDALTEEVLQAGFRADTLTNEIAGALQVRHFLPDIAPGDRAVVRGMMVVRPSVRARMRFARRSLPLFFTGNPSASAWTLDWTHGYRDPYHVTLTGNPTHTPMDRRGDDVTALAAVADGSLSMLAVGYHHGAVELLDIGTGRQVPVDIRVPENIVAMECFTGDDAWLIVVGETAVHVWDLARHRWRGEPLSGFDGGILTATAVHAAGGDAALAIAEGNGRIGLWDLRAGGAIAKLAASPGSPATTIYSFQSHDASRGYIAAGGDDGHVTIWDASSLTVSLSIATRHKGPVSALAAVRSSKRVLLATGGRDGAIGFWDPDNRLWRSGLFRAHYGAVLALSPVTRPGGGPMLASGGADATIRLWDADTESQAGAPLTGHTDAGHQLDDPGLLRSQAGALLTGHTGFVRALATPVLVNGDHTIASSGRDSSVRIWDLRDAEELYKLRKPKPRNNRPPSFPAGPVTAITSARVGADNTLCIVVGRTNGSIQLFSAADGTPVGDRAYMHAGGVALITELRMSGDEHFVATVGKDNTVKVWDFSSVGPVAELPLPGKGKILTLAAIRRNGRDTLLAVGGSTGHVQIWDVHGRRETPLVDAHDGQITSMTAVETDYQTTRLLTGGADGRIRFWDPDTGEHDDGPDITGLANPTFTMAVLPGPDGPVLAAGGNNTVRRFDLLTRRYLGTFTGQGKDRAMALLACLTTESGQTVLVGVGRQHTIRIWRPATAEVIHRLVVPGPVLASHAFGQQLVFSTPRGLYQLSLTLPDHLAGPLTARDIDVLREISLGYEPTEAADRLSISSRGIFEHLRNIRRKLGVSDRDEAVLIARAQGLIG